MPPPHYDTTPKPFLLFCWKDLTTEASPNSEPSMSLSLLSVGNSLIKSQPSVLNVVGFTECYKPSVISMLPRGCGVCFGQWAVISNMLRMTLRSVGGCQWPWQWRWIWILGGMACVNILVGWGWPFWEYRQGFPPLQDLWHWHSAHWHWHEKQSPPMDRGSQTSCRWPVQCREPHD